MVSNENGYLFEGKNAGELAKKILLMIQNKDFVKMGKKSRQIILKRFSWEAANKKFMSVYYNSIMEFKKLSSR